MARPINYQKHEENIKLLEKAAEKISAQGREVSIASLAQEIGYSRQYINKTAYLRQRANELIQEYAQPKLVDVSWSAEEWQVKYRQLNERYQAKSKECDKLKAECKKAREERDTLKENIRILRGKVYNLDIKNCI